MSVSVSVKKQTADLSTAEQVQLEKQTVNNRRRNRRRDQVKSNGERRIKAVKVEIETDDLDPLAGIDLRRIKKVSDILDLE